MIVLEIPKSPILQMCYRCFNLAHYIISATHSMCSAKAVSHPESCQNMQVGRLKYSHSSINIFRFFEMEKGSKCYEVTMEEKNSSRWESTSNGVLMAHAEWLPGVQLRR